MWRNGANAGNRPTSRAAGVPTPTELFRIATNVAGPLLQKSRGHGHATIMDGGARSATDAVGAGCQARFGPGHGFHGVKAATNRAHAWDGHRYRPRRVASGTLASARGLTQAAASARIVTPLLTSAISVPVLTQAAAASTTMGVTAPSSLTRSTAPTSAIL